MRDYAKISSEFWISPMGKKIKNCGLEAKVIAFYLMTCSHTNMISFYYLPLYFIAHETGIPLEDVSKGINDLIEIKFCSYDDDTDHVWVHDMAADELGSLKKSDNRVKHIHKIYKKLPNISLRRAFFERYRDSFHLQPILSVSSKPLRSQEQKQDQKQKQNQDQKQFQKQDDDDVGATDVALSSSPLKIPVNKSLCLVKTPLAIDIAIPLKNNHHFLVTPTQLENWQKTYPNINVLQELRQIQAWNEANPTERKTTLTVFRHINTWLAKEHRESLHRQQSPPVKHANRLAERGLSPTLDHNLIVCEKWLNRTVVTEE
ncbi:hypothetical protein [Rickettsiella endosymbiont of Dermanyssus gallinae]|uniref:hypothetical protein n=1 Tax=Rickettsiella endosymbiont of Dermanyssus gallinae TaxID=2856608 RepID=UPI001C5340E8|nr:hypothetical protein [Rickettsiella endosymbiont of Dermanyssus gallinae]